LRGKIINAINESIRIKEELRKSVEAIEEIAREAIATLLGGGKIVLFGNGGSAADAQHIAAELVGKFMLERRPLPALALTTNASIITAITNDFSFDDVFAKQVEAFVQKDDLIVGISTSGESINVLRGMEVAKSKGAKTVGLIGKDGGRLAKIVDFSVKVSSNETSRIQEAHITIGHILCQLIEEALFTSKSKAVFLDRDGTIVRDVHYLRDPDQLEILPKSAEAIRLLNRDGFKVIVVTNQSAVERGYITEEELMVIHERLLRLLKNEGAWVDAIYYCPHHPDEGCECRKPGTKLFERAVEEQNLDPKRSYTVGDKKMDILAGHGMGTKTALVLSRRSKEESEDVKRWSVKPDFIGCSLLEAVEWILQVESCAGRTEADSAYSS